MQDYEKLGVFYLGRPYDPATGKSVASPLLYDSKDLVTHAMCVGMTGSGKTGLCIGLLEEAAIDGIPALIIDPKGDLANLLLTFPDLRPEDFLPWVNEDEARVKGLTREQFAAAQSETWRNGLERWDQDGERIRRLRAAADFTIYTPGSDAGVAVSALRSFSAPGPEVMDDRELLRERITATATSVLALLGIDANPLESREHVLLSNLLDHAWRNGQDLDIPNLILGVQKPPFDRVGVLDVESFYPAKERFSLAMAMNNLLASPGFEAWMEGEPLDIGQMLYTPQGKPRHSIFSIAHLSDTERMFFVSLLLGHTVSWMRSQSGTTSLRAIFYMDEIFGYLPPVANPPSKQPLMTLLKQARAFGLGVVLATQNPVDLDYKALANMGTWFIGRLQTERDKNRLLDGLEGALSTAGATFDRGTMDRLLAGLGQRVFLMNNVHESGPALLETRWALSYLPGPLTRTQIRQLMAERKTAPAEQSAAAAKSPTLSSAAAEVARPVLPAAIPQRFLPVKTGGTAGGELLYAPHFLVDAVVRYSNLKLKVDRADEVRVLAAITGDLIAVNWGEAGETGLRLEELEDQPRDGASFAELPPVAAQAKSYKSWSSEFVTWATANLKLELFQSATFKETSRPGEKEGDFRVRLGQLAREQRDQAADKLRAKYARPQAALQDRIFRARAALEREQQQAQQQKVASALSIGSTLLGAFLGRKATRGFATSARSLGRISKETGDVKRAEESLERLEEQLQQLEQDFQREIQDLSRSLDPLTEPFESIEIRPTKTNIQVRLAALAWAPSWRAASGASQQAWE